MLNSYEKTGNTFANLVRWSVYYILFNVFLNTQWSCWRHVKLGIKKQILKSLILQLFYGKIGVFREKRLVTGVRENRGVFWL